MSPCPVVSLNHMESHRSEACPLLVWDVAALQYADVGTVDAIARLQLAAKRLGLELRLHNARPELRELIDFAGLCDVLRASD